MTSVTPKAKVNGISPKVIAAMIGAGISSGLIGQVLIWLIGAMVSGHWGAGEVDLAYSSVPGPVIVLITTLLGVLGAYVPGFNTTDPLRTLGLVHLAGDSAVVAHTDDAVDFVPTPISDTDIKPGLGPR